MTDAEYRMKMDQLVAALQIFLTMTKPITQRDLDIMQETLTRADTLSFLMVPPVKFAAATKRISDQRKLLGVVRQVRRLAKELGHEV